MVAKGGRVQSHLEDRQGGVQRRRRKNLRMQKVRLEEQVSEGVGFDSTQHQLADFDFRLHCLCQGPNADVFQVVKG